MPEHEFAHNNFIYSNYQLNFDAPERTVELKAEPKILTNTIWMVRAAVMSERYIAPMPAFFVEQELLEGRLIPILPETRIEWPVLAAYYRSSAFVPMKVNIFVNFLKQKYGGVPPWEKRLTEKMPKLAKALGQSSHNQRSTA